MTVDQNANKAIAAKAAAKPEAIKDAEVVSSPRDDVAVKSKPITFGQQVFIWAMILLVGVIFGVGSSWTFLQQQQRVIDNVPENDILVRKDVAERLQRALISSGERFALGSFEAYARTIRMARVAAAEGLQPAGADLDRVTDDFLARTIPASANTSTSDSANLNAKMRTFRDLLLEQQGGKDEVTRIELRRLLAERTAVEALFARNVGAPAVPTSVSAVLDQLRATRLTVAEVELDAKHLMAEVKADDPEIQTTYDRLRSTRFTKRAQVTATVAAADLAALTAKQVIGDAEIATYYEQHKETYRKPAAAPVPPAVADPKAPAEYQTLAEVTAAIKATLARASAVQAAQAVIQGFNALVDDKGLEQADATAFSTAASAAGLVVTEALVINEPTDGQVDLGALGTIKDPAGLFSKDVGFITNPLQSAAHPDETKGQTWFVLRVTQRSPAGFRSLDEVRSEVQAILAGNRAYQSLLVEAEKLRAAAEAAGPGGLAKVIADPANAAWAGKIAEQPMRPLMELHAPATEAGSTSGESRLAASLALPNRPVALVEGTATPTGATAAGITAASPRVRLIQVTEIKQDPVPPGGAADAAAMYREALSRYQQTQFDRTLREKLGK